MLMETLELIFMVWKKQLKNQKMAAIFNELVLRDKSKSITSVMCYIHYLKIFL